MIVTFCGHSTIGNTDAIQEALEAAVRSALNQGATCFYLGGYGDFDRLAAATVFRLKGEYQSIDSVLVLPYMDKKVDASLYSRTCYPPIEHAPKRFAISYRNRWMVDMSDLVIAYVVHDWGGAYQTLCYAKRRGRTIISLSPRHFCCSRE